VPVLSMERTCMVGQLVPRLTSGNPEGSLHTSPIDVHRVWEPS